MTQDQMLVANQAMAEHRDSLRSLAESNKMAQEIQKFVVNGDEVEVTKWDGSLPSHEYIYNWSNNRTNGSVSENRKLTLFVPVDGKYEEAFKDEYIFRRTKDGSMFVMDEEAFIRFKDMFATPEQ